MPDTTLPGLFLVASSKVNPNNQGSRGSLILLRLTIMAAPLFPLKKDKEGLYSYFYGLELTNNFKTDVFSLMIFSSLQYLITTILKF